MKSTVLFAAVITTVRLASALLHSEDGRHTPLQFSRQEILLVEDDSFLSHPRHRDAHSSQSSNLKSSTLGPSKHSDSQLGRPHSSDPSAGSTLDLDHTLDDPFTTWALGARPGEDRWAMVYFPYNDDSTCKSARAVARDIASIASKGFTSIRLHAIDCNVLPNIGPLLQRHNLRLIVGVDVDDEGLEAAQPQINELIRWGQQKRASSKTKVNFSLVELVVLGEETLFNEFLPSAQALADFLSTTRSKLFHAGYKGPVTTTEPIATLYEHAAILCPVIDVPAANIHPFFHTDVAANEAGRYVRDALRALEHDVCRGHARHPISTSTSTGNSDAPIRALNLETGWPSRGSVNGRAVPGAATQRIAIQAILDADVARQSAFLGFVDDGWKDAGDLGVEGSWGCHELF